MTNTEHRQAAEQLLARAGAWAEKDAARQPGHNALVLPAQVDYALRAAAVHAQLAGLDNNPERKETA